MRSLIALALLFGVAGCDKAAEQPSQPAAGRPAGEPAGTLDMAQRGRAMPATVFQGPDGQPLTLAAFKGKPVLVNLWATWCGPCVREMPSLDRLAAKAGDRLQVVAISQDSPQAQDPVPGWWANAKLSTLKLYRDPKTDLGFEYGGGMLPTTVLYDKNGRELWRFFGGLDWESPRAQEMLREVLA